MVVYSNHSCRFVKISGSTYSLNYSNSPLTPLKDFDRLIKTTLSYNKLTCGSQRSHLDSPQALESTRFSDSRLRSLVWVRQFSSQAYLNELCLFRNHTNNKPNLPSTVTGKVSQGGSGYIKKSVSSIPSQMCDPTLFLSLQSA